MGDAVGGGGFCGVDGEGDARGRWHFQPTGKNMRGWKRTGRPVLKCQTGTEYSYKYRRIQELDRPSVSP